MAIPEVFDDFDRVFEHLADNPLIGRPVRGGKRELVIGQDSRGYVALYRFVPEIDTVFVLAIRSQRDCGQGAKAR